MGKRKNDTAEGKANKKAKVQKNEENAELEKEVEEQKEQMEEVEVQVTPSKKEKKNKKDKNKKAKETEEKVETEITSPTKSDKKKKDKKKKDTTEAKAPELKAPAKTPAKTPAESDVKNEKKKKKEKKAKKEEETQDAQETPEALAVTAPPAGDDEEDDGFVIGGTGGGFQLQGGKMKLSGAGGNSSTSNATPSKKLYVGGIPYTYKDKDLRELFGEYGTIEDIYIPEMPDNPGKIKGFAFVTFSTEEEAGKALEKNGLQCGVKALKVEFTNNDKGGNKGGKFGGGGDRGNRFGGGAGGGKFGGGDRGSKRGNSGPLGDTPPEGCDSLFCGNLAYTIQDADVYSFFDGCDVQEIRYVEDKQSGEFKGSAFIQFSSKEGLIKAGKLNGQTLCNRPVYLDFAKPRGSR